VVCIPEKITELIDATHIPTIPESVLGFMQLVDNENTSIAELAAFIGQDPALTATVLSFMIVRSLILPVFGGIPYGLLKLPGL